jgi:hypothetical protein
LDNVEAFFQDVNEQSYIGTVILLDESFATDPYYEEYVESPRQKPQRVIYENDQPNQRIYQKNVEYQQQNGARQVVTEYVSDRKSTPMSSSRVYARQQVVQIERTPTASPFRKVIHSAPRSALRQSIVYEEDDGHEYVIEAPPTVRRIPRTPVYYQIEEPQYEEPQYEVEEPEYEYEPVHPSEYAPVQRSARPTPSRTPARMIVSSSAKRSAVKRAAQDSPSFRPEKRRISERVTELAPESEREDTIIDEESPVENYQAQVVEASDHEPEPSINERPQSVPKKAKTQKPVNIKKPSLKSKPAAKPKLVSKPSRELVVVHYEPPGDDESESGKRRSNRTKVPPLAYWKNERVVYGRRESGIHLIKDVIRAPPTPESRPHPVSKSNGSKPRPKKPIPSEITVRNFSTNEEEMQSTFT